MGDISFPIRVRRIRVTVGRRHASGPGRRSGSVGRWSAIRLTGPIRSRARQIGRAGTPITGSITERRILSRRSATGIAEGSEQTSSLARCCQDGRVGDCKDGRVKIGQIISRIMASGIFLVGSCDCKDGRDKSHFTPDSKHITLIAKKDVIDGRFFY